MVKSRLAATKHLYEYLFKVSFPNIYKNNNYKTYYNYRLHCKDCFVTFGAKKLNFIVFAIFVF